MGLPSLALNILDKQVLPSLAVTLHSSQTGLYSSQKYALNLSNFYASALLYIIHNY